MLLCSSRVIPRDLDLLVVFDRFCLTLQELSLLFSFPQVGLVSELLHLLPQVLIWLLEPRCGKLLFYALNVKFSASELGAGLAARGRALLRKIWDHLDEVD